ncbi:UbiA family prenyltransferase, partial [Actinosynnema sp. NPDC059335]|uniref:UbiA family prenyltransferase n=1 Tax=Actinosynnema sp. NPDC059335 TaxID=3346804 RepID=UPI003672E1F4
VCPPARGPRATRPERPIPSGRVSPERALAVAGGLGVLGLALAAAAGGRRALGTAAALTGAVWAYDVVLKDTPAGPFAMAACRGLDVLLGAPADGVREALPAASVMAAHTLGVTVLSRGEVHGTSPGVARAVLAGTAATALAAVAAGARGPGEAGSGGLAGVRDRLSAGPRGGQLAGERPAAGAHGGSAAGAHGGPAADAHRGPAADAHGGPAADARGRRSAGAFGRRSAGVRDRPAAGHPGRSRDRRPVGARSAVWSAVGAAVYAGLVGRAQLAAVRSGGGAGEVRAATAAGIHGMVPLQAALAARGSVWSALAVAGALPLARKFGRKVGPT